MIGGIPILLLAAFLALIGVGLLGLTLARAQTRDKKVRQRIQTATSPHLRMRRAEALNLMRVQATQKASPFGRAAKVFGFDPARPEQYPVRWWVVLGIMLVVARVLSGITVMLFGGVGWIAWPAAWVFGCRQVFKWWVTRRREKLFMQFPDALSMIVRSIRSGVPLTEAIRIVADQSPEPTGGEFSQVAGELSIGASVGDALTAMANRNAITEYRFFATALTLQAQTGGRLGETLESLAQVVRKRTAAKSRGKALASEARTSASILAGLPILAMGGLWLLNPAYMQVLFTEKMGRTFLIAAFGSLFAGMYTMRTIIQKTLA